MLPAFVGTLDVLPKGADGQTAQLQSIWVNLELRYFFGFVVVCGGGGKVSLTSQWRIEMGLLQQRRVHMLRSVLRDVVSAKIFGCSGVFWSLFCSNKCDVIK